jgi:hypothetical protein
MLTANNQARGVINFPVVQDLIDLPVCGVLITNVSTGPITYGGANAITIGWSPVFLTLYDVDGNAFIYDCPQLYFSVLRGQPPLFRPRKLDMSKCYLKFSLLTVVPGASFFITVFHA